MTEVRELMSTFAMTTFLMATLLVLLAICAGPHPMLAATDLPATPAGDPTGTITGVVRSLADGLPLSDVHVALYGESHSFPNPRRVDTTNQHGEYSFSTTDEDVYRIGFNTVSATPLFVSEYYSGALSLSEAMTFAVGAGSVLSNVNVSLALRGRVLPFATSAAFSATLFAYYPDHDLPDYRTASTSTWTQLDSAPWWNISVAPDGAAVAIVPRQLPGAETRFLVAVPTYSIPGFGVGTILYRSGDGGESWASFSQPCGFAGYFEPETTLLMAPGDPRRLYLLTTCAFFDFTGFYRASMLHESKDGGITWTQLHKGNAGSEIISELAIDAAGSSTLYVRMDSAYGERRSLRWSRRDEDSQSWQTVFDLDSPFIRDALLTVSRSDSNHLFLIDLSGLRTSTNNGASWSAPIDQPCIQNMIQLLALPGQNAGLLLRCGDGLFRSEDGGASWQRLHPNPGRHLAVDLGRPGTLLWARGERLWQSTDRGTSWNEIAGPREDRLFLPSIRLDSTH